MTTDDANQNAALAAIMFLAGGVGKDSPHCIITLVGSDPTVRPLALNRKQALAMVDQRAHDVLHEKVNCDAIGTPCDQRVHFQVMPHVHFHLRSCCQLCAYAPAGSNIQHSQQSS